MTTDTRDYFQTALTMAHALRTLPDDYEDAAHALLARHPEAKAYLEAGVAPVVIEALVACGRLIAENIDAILTLQKVYGASGAVALIRELPPSEGAPLRADDGQWLVKARQLGMTHTNMELFKAHIKKLSRVTLSERRAKRRERRGR